MSVTLFNGKPARKLLALQLLTFVLFGIGFATKEISWGYSAVLGGLSAWLPSVVFMLFALRHQAHTPAGGRVAWSFAIGEALKVVSTIVLMIVSLGWFKAALFPLGLTYIAVLVVQIVAPAMIGRSN